MFIVSSIGPQRPVSWADGSLSVLSWEIRDQFLRRSTLPTFHKLEIYKIYRIKILKFQIKIPNPIYFKLSFLYPNLQFFKLSGQKRGMFSNRRRGWVLARRRTGLNIFHVVFYPFLSGITTQYARNQLVWNLRVMYVPKETTSPSMMIYFICKNTFAHDEKLSEYLATRA